MMHFNLTRLGQRTGRAIAFLILAICCIGWGLYFLVSELRPTEDVTVRLAAGSSVTRRFQVAQFLADEARAHGVDMQVVSIGDYREALQDAAEGRLDMGLVSSGLNVPGYENLRLLAGLDAEPLHILVRRKLVEKSASLREAIRGSRVSLGSPNTNDHLVGRDIMNFLRLTAKDSSGRGDYFDVSISREELCRLADQVQALSGQEREALVSLLPDVVMTIAAIPSKVAQKALDTGEYTLMPFPYAEHYLTSQLEHSERASLGVDRLEMQPTQISAAMYVGDFPIPAENCPTIGMRTLLVARANLPLKTVKRVMQSVFDTDFATRIHAQSPREISTDLALHPGAKAYLDRDKHLLTGSFFADISQALSIFGAFSAGALSLYGYLRRRHIRRPGEYLEEIRRIDALALGQSSESDVPTSPDARASYLLARLVKLKEQLIQDYCENRVQGDTVLMNILSMLADTRSHLAGSANQPFSPASATEQQPTRERSAAVLPDNYIAPPSRRAA